MVTISKALSAGQAQSYHKLEFTSETQSYYKQDGAVEGQWQGRLAEKFGLTGPVDAAEFARLSEGKHPTSEAPLVRHREAQEYTNADGTTTKAVEHRAAWDATFSAPKSVSLTALVGGDDQVREAHGAAVTTALAELERYTQARIGGNHAAETTGKFIAAKFEHDTARPVDGYAAPPAPHTRRHLQCHRAGRWIDEGVATAGIVRQPELCDGGLPVRLDLRAAQSRL